jgi:hypothetical protein
MKEAATITHSIGGKYFEHFYWENIARIAAEKLTVDSS